jgi:Putative Ig domain
VRTLFGNSSPIGISLQSVLEPAAGATVLLYCLIIGCGGSSTKTPPLAAPSNLTYAQTTITATAGTAITADAPSVTGTVAKYSVSPALPAGLTLDAPSGVIAGTPIQGSAQSAYTVTAANSAGNTTAKVTITVTQTSKVLLELGHGVGILALRIAGDRVLSEDTSGHWNLWDYATGNIVASGDGAATGTVGQIDLDGTVAVIGSATTIQVLAATDGSVMGSIPNAAWWKLATDGSYLCTGSATALTAWSPSGTEEFTRSGDYHAAVVFAAPSQVQVAGGPAGANVIENISVPGGTDFVSPAFQGAFNTWFSDGSGFISTSAPTVWAYSNTSVQQGVAQSSTATLFGGYGGWFWTLSLNQFIPPGTYDVIQIYAVGGGGSPAYTLTISYGSEFTISGPFIEDFNYSGIDIVDLSGKTPSVTTYPDSLLSLDYYTATTTTPPPFAFSSSSQWVGGNQYGVIYDGTTLSTTPRYFNYGAVQGIAGSPNLVALSTTLSCVLLLDPSGATPPPSPINLQATHLQFSADSSVLGATTLVPIPGTLGELENSHNFYSLPSQKLISTLTPSVDLIGYNTGASSDFTLSASGTTVGIMVHQIRLEIPSRRDVSPISGSPIIWSAGGLDAPIVLSPDGSLIAAPDETVPSDVSIGIPNTSIYKNGNLVITIPVYAEGWIDDGHLLAASYDANLHLVGTAIYGPDGSVLSQVPGTTFPAIASPIFLSSDTVYDPGSNAVYSLTTGAVVWSAAPGATTPPACSVAGMYVVCQVGHQVVLYPY